MSKRDKWQRLAQALEALDRATAVEVQTAHGRVLGVVGADWSLPSGASSSERVDYLQRAVDAAKAGLEKAKQLSGKVRDESVADATKALEAAKSIAVDTAKDLGVLVLFGPAAGVVRSASKAAPETTSVIEEKLGKVATSIEETAKEIPGFLFWFGATAVTFQMLMTAGLLYAGYVYYVKPKRRAA